MQPIFEITENLCKAEHGSAEIAAAILKMAQSHTNLVKECPLAPVCTIIINQQIIRILYNF